jgi:TonB family protein
MRPVTSRLMDLDRQYRRRMSLTVPLAAATLVAALFSVPAERITALREAQIAQKGPLRILPQLDIVPDEESPRRLTAAPVAATPADFVALDIVYETDVLDDPLEPVPVRVPVPEISKDDPFDFSTLEDLQTAIRTTGLPVPAQAELEVVHVERPIYPPRAVQLSIQGTVEVMMLVDAQGRVSQVFVVDPESQPLLEIAAVEAAERFLFKPYQVGGRATPFWVRLPFMFHLVF